MTHLDPQITVMLDRLVPTTDETGKWERVLADADAIRPRRIRSSRSRRLALVLAAVAALAAALAFVPALAGQGYFWFLNPHGPQPTTSVVTVTSITDRSGMSWQITAYRSEHNGLCYQLTPEGSSGVGAGACSEVMPINSLTTEQGEHGSFVLGPVTADAQRVEISGSGTQVEATVASAPEALHTDIKFYVAQLPVGMADASLIIRALDDQGAVIATWGVPARSTP